jgi:hypothetical protein
MINRRSVLSALFGTGVSLASAKALASVKPALEAGVSEVRDGIMKCHLCVAEGQKSKLYIDCDETIFLDAKEPPKAYYWDEEGVGHFHSADGRTDVYHCSRGHRFSITEYEQCTGCGFVSKPTVISTLPSIKANLTS